MFLNQSTANVGRISNSIEISSVRPGSEAYHNSSWSSNTYAREQTKPALVLVMACRLFRVEPIFETMLALLTGLLVTECCEFWNKITTTYMKISSAKWQPFSLGLSMISGKGDVSKSSSPRQLTLFFSSGQCRQLLKDCPSGDHNSALEC